jgi:thioredoxin reductase
VLGADQRALQLALHLTGWSDDVVWCSNGPLPAPLEEAGRAPLAARGVRLQQEPIVRLEGTDGQLKRVVFASGGPLERRAAFLHPPTRQRSDLPGQLGCTLLEDGSVSVGDFGQTSVPGLFAAGDMARRPTMPVPGAQVVIAAAEGAIAAVAIDQDLVLNNLAG